MAYRLRFPTIDEFIQKAVNDYGAEEKTTTIIGPNGPEVVKYLQRTINGQIVQAPLQKQEMLYRNDVRSLCSKLKIPANIFDDCFDSPIERYFDDLGRLIDPDDADQKK